MSWTPIASDFIQLQSTAAGASASGYYFKAYAAGTTSPISIALDSAGSTTVAKVELDSLGYVQNSSGGSAILYIDQAYRLVLYTNATDADANTFASAVQDEDNIPQVSTVAGSAAVKNFATLAAAVADTGLVDGDALNIAGRNAKNDGGAAAWDVVLASTVTTNTYNIVQCTGVATLALALRVGKKVIGYQWGMVADNYLDDFTTTNGSRTDNAATLQSMIAHSEANGDLDICLQSDKHGYYCSTFSKTEEETVQFTVGTTKSLTLKGNGKSTILVGTGSAAATYDGNGINDGTESILRIHKSNVVLKGLQFRESPAPLYIGHDPDNASRGSHSSIGRYENLWFQKCGTPILLQPGKTLYYNKFDSIQFQDFQIGIHFGLPYLTSGTTLDVSNRNFFSNMSFNNGWVGILAENGDSNCVTDSNFEVMTGTGNAVGSAPAQLLDGIATAIYTNQSAHPYAITGWKMNNLHAEACTRDLYLDNVDMSFNNVLFDMDKITIVGNNPMYIGSAIDGGGGEFSSFNWGDLHCKFRVAGPDPFIPDAGDTTDDRGVYITAGRISDEGGRRRDRNLGRDSGTVNSIGASTTLTDTNQAWEINEWEGAVVTNTDGASGATGTVLSNTATTITATMTGGGDDDLWNNGDTYTVIMTPHITSQDAGKTTYWSLGGVHEWFGFIEFTKDASLSATEDLRLTLPGTGTQDSQFSSMQVTAIAAASAIPEEVVLATYRAGIPQIDIGYPGAGWTATSNKVHFHFRWFDA